MALGVLGVLVLVGATVSKLATSGRWNTVLTSNEKRAEECAEAASNLMFKVVKDKVNDDSIFYKNLPLPANPIDLMKSEFMYFRLPAPVATTHINGLSGIGDYQSKGMDIQLDLLSNTVLKKIYERGINYRYDSETDNKGPLAALGDMYKSYGGRVSVSCTARIRQSFGILSDNPKFKIAGIELPARNATGFFSGIFDKLFPDGVTSVEDQYQGTDPVSNDSGFKIDSLIELIPDKPKLLKAPKVGTILINVYGVQIDAGPVIQIFVDMIFDKILDAIGIDVTPRGIAQLIFKNINLDIKLPFDGIKDRLKEAITKCLPEELRAFTGSINYGVTVEKKGFLEVETLLDFYPKASDNSHVIRKKLLVQREFRVADIQPIAPSHSFFVANSALTYEDESVENDDNWKGDDQINWNDGFGDLVIQNMPGFKDLISFFDMLIHDFSFKNILRNVMLPGLVRVNGTKPMQVKLGMFPSLTDFSVENLKKIEVLALAVGHKDDSKSACDDKGHDKHNLVPGFKSIPFNFWSNAESFDWGYMAGGDAPGSTYWIPFPPRFARTCFFGYFHISPPFSFRMEGNLRKVYSHLKIHLIQIIIPPIPPWFLGITIPIPWLWANSYAEPYGFCKWPGYDDEDKAKESWDPSKPANLPENLYSPVQYLKKASYYYNSSQEFNSDINNRSIMIGDEKVFICDGVTFVNDSLTLPKMKVQGRGIIVATGNITVNGNLERVEHYNDGNPSIFSIVARNGSVMVGPSCKLIEACVYGDRGLQVTPGSKLEINGNLCINRCKRSDIGGNVTVYYKSKHCRSSLLSMIRPIAKYEPTRYYVTLSSKISSFKFVKPN